MVKHNREYLPLLSQYKNRLNNLGAVTQEKPCNFFMGKIYSPWDLLLLTMEVNKTDLKRSWTYSIEITRYEDVLRQNLKSTFSCFTGQA